MSKTARRPRRQKKGDRLVSPGASAEQTRCDYALAPFDRLARKMDLKWGVDRLPELVSPETAQKFGSAMAKLNAAIDAENPDDVLKRAQVCMRGLAAMDREAEETGQPQSDPRIWECEVNGWKFGIIEEVGDWMAAKDKRPDLEIFTMREVAIRMLDLHHPMIAEAKRQFGGAEIVAINRSGLSKEFWDNGGDELPW